jgi:guanidinobutyrase
LLPRWPLLEQLRTLNLIHQGAGALEVGGLTAWQRLEIIRGFAGLNITGTDLVEVSTPYDMAGTTAPTAANFLYEML